MNINVDLSGIPTVPGVTSATDQFTNAVNDLNAALTANGVNDSFSINGSNSGPQVFIDIDTSPGVGPAETTQIPGGGWSSYAEISININHTATNGTPNFSTNGVSATSPMGYDSVFYKMALHELLHTLGLDNTNVASPPNIMNGINSTNDQNNSLGNASQGPASLLTPCVIAQVKAAITAIVKPAPQNDSGYTPDPPPDLPEGWGGGTGGAGSIYNCIIWSWDEWDDNTNTLTGYLESVCAS